MHSPYFLEFVPNYHERVRRNPKYTFERILDIIFKHDSKTLRKIKYKILKLEDFKKIKHSVKEKMNKLKNKKKNDKQNDK